MSTLIRVACDLGLLNENLSNLEVFVEIFDRKVKQLNNKKGSPTSGMKCPLMRI